MEKSEGAVVRSGFTLSVRQMETTKFLYSVEWLALESNSVDWDNNYLPGYSYGHNIFEQNIFRADNDEIERYTKPPVLWTEHRW